MFTYACAWAYVVKKTGLQQAILFVREISTCFSCTRWPSTLISCLLWLALRKPWPKPRDYIQPSVSFCKPFFYAERKIELPVCYLKLQVSWSFGMMYCLVSAVVIQAILTEVNYSTVQSSFRKSTEIIGVSTKVLFWTVANSLHFFSFIKSTSFPNYCGKKNYLHWQIYPRVSTGYAHDRAKWDLGRASSDVIAGTGLKTRKHSRDVWLGFERCENIFGVFKLLILSKMDKTFQWKDYVIKQYNPESSYD